LGAKKLHDSIPIGITVESWERNTHIPHLLKPIRLCWKGLS
jgi:hypothetical protein